MKKKDDFLQKIEELLMIMPKATTVLLSEDAYKVMGLKGKTILTSKGKLKLQIVASLQVVGVNDGRSKIITPKFEKIKNKDLDEDDDGQLD